MNYYIQNKRAFAFSITMWIIASLLFATVVILRFAKDELKLSVGLNDKLQTELIAESVLESIKFYVPTADYTFTSLKNTLLDNTLYPLPNEIILDGREYNITNKITISLKDTSSMLHVMYAPSLFISKLLTTQKDDESSSILQDSLDDWRDEDNVAKVNGAEQNFYSSLGKKVLVRNTKAIQDIHELKLIKGFENIDFNTIKSNLYYGRGGTINLMLINNKRYLATLLGVEENFITNLLELRESEPYKFIKSLDAIPDYNDDYMGLGISKQFKITIKVKQGIARTVLNTMISFKQLNSKPYIIVSYTIN